MVCARVCLNRKCAYLDSRKPVDIVKNISYVLEKPLFTSYLCNEFTRQVACTIFASAPSVR